MAACILLTAWASVGGGFGPTAARIIDGCVIDGATGTALSGARVALLESAGAHQTTGADGRFRFADLDGNGHTLRIFKAGYAPRDVDAAQATSESGAQIALQPRQSGRVAGLPAVEVSREIDYVPNLAVAPVRRQAAR